MRTGNIVKTAYGDIVIINTIYKDNISWISATHGNVCGTTPKITTQKLIDCDCTIENGEIDCDCIDCNGTGKITKIIYGMDKATVLADNMYDYIKSKLMKSFDF